MTGETIGMALGVHRGNGSRGSFGLSLLAAVGSGLVGAVIVDQIGSPAALVTIPVLQLGATVLVQRRTTRAAGT
ncbi:MAG: hypothetical protein FIB01_16375 [Gemmatimonadetes bacterium]|nr:hypothetical protein [Gemmatimonadota bacterium]